MCVLWSHEDGGAASREPENLEVGNEGSGGRGLTLRPLPGINNILPERNKRTEN